MAFLEWRKFHFFDLKKNVDNGKIAELLRDTKITVTSSGNNCIVLCDDGGQIHLIARSWHSRTFRAYEIGIEHVQQLRNSPILVTIGHDESGINPLIKVWDTSRFDKNATPYCCRITRAIPGNRPVHTSCLTVHENMQIMAVGFIDGSLVLYRGDITRERNTKQKLLRDASSAVTGLAFKTTSTGIFLFLATETSIIVYNITQKDKEIRYQLDNSGCLKNCSVLAESMLDTHFMVGRDDAIYCYTPDGRGPCYAVDGPKLLLEWFRSYLVIFSKPNQNFLTVLDIHNKFIVYSNVTTPIRAVFNEWGAFYLLDTDNHLHHLDENDLQSKLALLFKKNLYDVAIRIAKSQQYDNESLVDIFRQYGDHLCEKGDFSGAIEQYIKTIGKLEPSYVIRKFLDSQHLDKLTKYLESVHKLGQATEDHTTLLLNCYTKLNNTVGQMNSLKEFILMKEDDLNYDIDIAIKVCRQGSPSEALMLAKKHKKHDWYIKLQLEDHQKYNEVLDYIGELSFTDGEVFLKKYGAILLEKAPFQFTQLLKRFSSTKIDPEDYIHLFLKNSERLIEFLEFLLENSYILTVTVYNTLLEHYLNVWKLNQDDLKLAQKILKFLQNPDINYDKSQALVLCHLNSFNSGLLYLYEEQKLYQQILRHHISRNDTSAIIGCCRRFGHQEPSLWLQALWSCIRATTTPSIELLKEILTVISKERLMSPQLLIDAIGMAGNEITLGHIRHYIVDELQSELQKTREIDELTINYSKDIDKLRKELQDLRSGSVVIQGSRCAACHHPLELPTLHFLCQHSYHQHCFQSFCEDENECPACQPENKNLLELLKAMEYNNDIHENFHSQLDKADDGFSVAAEYFGRGVFNRFKVIGYVEKPVSVLPATSREVVSEGRIRQKEKKSAVLAMPMSEGRIRLQEQKYSSSLEANINHGARNSNPFENDYDESKNPFADEDGRNDKNPFNDDCDNNSNPFYN